LTEYFDRTNGRELLSAGNEFLALLGIFAAIRPLLEWGFGKHAFAFRSAAQLMSVDPKAQALLIILWHVIRISVVTREEVSTILNLQDEVARTAANFEKVRKLAEQNVEIEQAIQPPRIREAIKNPRESAALAAELRRQITSDTGKA
jgi:hypothetical protein